MSRTAVGAGSSDAPGLSAPNSPFSIPPKRTAPFDQEPGFYKPAGLWLYGNARLLDSCLAHVESALGPPSHTMDTLDQIERSAEALVLSRNVLVTGIHNLAHMRAAVVPLRWGSPRILVLSGGFKYHLGERLDQEPFRTARLWRYQWDSRTDLAISRRVPDKLPTYATHNPAIDRMIELIVDRRWPGLLFEGPVT
ncbi:MAG: hypothetical protein HONBIEJF_02560 [Fimbriimonadaceae bacterium]|nr:hypothetical protein [Fimbriimonadaceae bacterium]